MRVSPPVPRQLGIVYQISGSAQNGDDYDLIPNALVVPTNTYESYIYIQPRYDTNLEFDESVTLTLVLTNGYLIDPDHRAATLFIKDCITNVFTVVATNVPSPIEIGYHDPTKSLMLSVNYPLGQPNNFARLDTNGTLTQWSSVSALDNEVKFAIPATTASGWTNGAIYFGNGTSIGYMSPDAGTVVRPWVTLTNGTVPNPLYLRGSLCFDQTGVWSNNLIAVTSDEAPDDTPKGVWAVDTNGQPTLIANITTGHLEGLTTIPNDPARWGPWAGKILTGDEDAHDADGRKSALIFATATNGAVTTYALGIEPEDFHIVPPNQDLYCVNFNSSDSKILKVSKSLLKDFVADLVVTQAGEYNPYGEYALNPKLFFVHWDGTAFQVRSINLPTDVFPGNLEHVAFAPLELPNIPQ